LSALRQAQDDNLLGNKLNSLRYSASLILRAITQTSYSLFFTQIAR